MLDACFPSEKNGYLASLEKPPVLGIRANTLKITPDSLGGLLKTVLRSVPWCENGFYYDAPLAPSKSPFFNAGLFYLQEPSAMSAVAVLNPRPGDIVLDVCAAPGGKTTQIAAALRGAGAVFANDKSLSRVGALTKNVDLSGAKNVCVLNETPHNLAACFPLFFDKILIDAPCSGEGMFRKDRGAIKHYGRYKPEILAKQQQNILKLCDCMLKPGGEMLYCTCTFGPVENEAVIGSFLNERPNYDILPINKNFGFEPGNPAFYKNGGRPCLCGTARIWPHRVSGEGFFLAHLKKSEAARQNARRETQRRREKPIRGKGGARARNASRERAALGGFKEFCRENLTVSLGGAGLTRAGGALYENIAGAGAPSGLNVRRPGRLLGTFCGERFLPSQALAMSLKPHECARTLNLAEADERVARFLKGEPFAANLADGYCLVCVSGYPLGFGFVKRGTMKNKLMKSWAAP